jgi:hypothetical protein
MSWQRFGVTRVTPNRWETGICACPTLLEPALKGIAFTHGPACTCSLCYKRYPRAAKERDIRETRPPRLPRPEPAAVREEEAAS